ncbi:hypothetical protein EQ831_16005 [Pseudomonas sp. ALS1279]|nr:hypothetical protein EQ831_16005 [Pseudomonas sp. ALS1279]
MPPDYSKCWANYRADCDRGMSKEHLISKSLFPDKNIYVSGFEWCKKSERHIGINALQRKHLCTKHNNDLSPTDETAKHSISAFATGNSESSLNGSLLERWLVKTAVNLSIGCNNHIGCGMAESKPGWPSPYLLAVAFGDEVLSEKMGAYFLFPNTQYAHRANEILISPISRDGYIGGYLFGLRGQFIFLNLYPGHAPPPIHEIAPNFLPEEIGTASLVYRPTSLKVNIKGCAEGTIQIQWPTA